MMAFENPKNSLTPADREHFRAPDTAAPIEDLDGFSLLGTSHGEVVVLLSADAELLALGHGVTEINGLRCHVSA
jgi:hypothetical protein